VSSGNYVFPAITVDGLPLSDILSDSEIKTARIIKIDVEGAEYEVIQGMMSAFARFPRDLEVVVEITPSALGEEKMRWIFEFFERNGFFPYHLENIYEPGYYFSPKKPDRPARIKELPSKQVDVVFSRSDADLL